jgi:hypothetical protein
MFILSPDMIDNLYQKFSFLSHYSNACFHHLLHILGESRVLILRVCIAFCERSITPQESYSSTRIA